jgi:hypothetical protein
VARFFLEVIAMLNEEPRERFDEDVEADEPSPRGEEEVEELLLEESELIDRVGLPGEGDLEYIALNPNRPSLDAYTEDAEILQDFAERQDLGNPSALADELDAHNSLDPLLTGGDIDAAWEWANVGDETPGGTAPTPDQDRVDEIGEALGITYDDDEPLNTEEKMLERDAHRWELDPASGLEEQAGLELLDNNDEEE